MKQCAWMLLTWTGLMYAADAAWADKWCHIAPMGGSPPYYDWYSERWSDDCQTFIEQGIEPTVTCEESEACDLGNCHSIARYGSGYVCVMEQQCCTIWVRGRRGRCYPQTVVRCVPVLRRAPPTECKTPRPLPAVAGDSDLHALLPDDGDPNTTTTPGAFYTFRFRDNQGAEHEMLGQLIEFRSPSKATSLYFARQVHSAVRGDATRLNDGTNAVALGGCAERLPGTARSHAYTVEVDLSALGHGRRRVLCLLP